MLPGATQSTLCGGRLDSICSWATNPVQKEEYLTEILDCHGAILVLWGASCVDAVANIATDQWITGKTCSVMLTVSEMQMW